MAAFESGHAGHKREWAQLSGEILGWGMMSPVPVGSATPEGVRNGRVSASLKDSRADSGKHLRAARLDRGVSLREMARRIGVSPSFVSQVELGKAQPSLGTLYGFLSELDLSLDELMPSTNSAQPSTGGSIRANAEGPFGMAAFTEMWMQLGSTAQPWSDHPRVQMKGVTWRRLTADDPMVDFLHVTYEAGSESCPPENLMRHEGHEYGHIMSGSLRVQVGFETFDRGAGDAINFPSTTPHRLGNEGPETCISIWVVVGRRITARVLNQDATGNQPHTH